MVASNTILAIVSVLAILALSKSETVDEGHVLDTREKMCQDAVDALVAKYDAIETSSAEEQCGDITSYKFPDMCQKPADEESYEPYYLKVDEGSEEPRKVIYNDERESGNANALKDLESNEKFNDYPTGSYIGFKVQPQTEQGDATNEEMCAASGAGDVFKQHSIGESEWGKLASTTSWQYFGGQKTGLFAQYPASVKTMCWCDDYDPRYRPWYSAAVTGPKDMILVLDRSGSMENKDRMNIMKSGALAQLDTLTFLDYVSVVSYSADVDTASDVLLQATDENKARMREFIENLSSGGNTKGQLGLEKAFDIFIDSEQKSKTSGCTRIISFLTDGKMTGGAGFIEDGWLDGQQSRMVNNGLSKAHIFTYALGDGAETSDMRSLACRNRGWMAKIKDGDAAGIKHAMTRYFEYFAGKLGSNASLAPRWSEFYMDSSGQGKMTTVSKAVFTNRNNRREFEGVIGIDVLVSDFGENIDDNEMATLLNDRSKACINFDFSLSDLTPMGSTTVTVNGNQVQCEVEEYNPTGSMVPTGATHDEVDDNHCDGSLPWWAVLLIVLFSLCFCCGPFLFCISRRKKQRNAALNQHKTVQMQQQQQRQYVQPNQQYHLQARQTNVQVVQAQHMPNQQMVMPMQGGAMPMQGGAMPMQGGAMPMHVPGQIPMQGMQIPHQGVAQPIGMGYAQPMGVVQGVPMQQHVQPIAVQQNTAATQQSQNFGQPNP